MHITEFPGKNSIGRSKIAYEKVSSSFQSPPCFTQREQCSSLVIADNKSPWPESIVSVIIARIPGRISTKCLANKFRSKTPQYRVALVITAIVSQWFIGHLACIADSISAPFILAGFTYANWHNTLTASVNDQLPVRHFRHWSHRYSLLPLWLLLFEKNVLSHITWRHQPRMN